ncbi:hypothetical protein ACJROX_18920 [Pseudalkalibacillus sp. A8]|uniref:hypothetical protein n=1 Tax=Pseudalkalibacillus sp. A8 TaxID=3382641 RepID=UPI0038B511B8
MSSSVWIPLSIIHFLLYALLWGVIRFNFKSNEFYGDELNKKKNKQKQEDEAYEKATAPWFGKNNNHNGS